MPKLARRNRSPPARRRAASASPPWSDARWALVLGGLAALLRVLFLLSGVDRSWPYTAFYEGDSEAFFRFARALLAGELYDSGLPFHPPGFAFLLAGLHLVVGAGGAGAAVPHLAVKAILAGLLGGGTVALLFLAVARALGRPAAIAAALLAAGHFGLYVLAVAPVGDGLYQALLLAAIVVLVRTLDGGRRAPAAGLVALGALWGLLALVRAEGIAHGGALAAVGLFTAWRAGRGATGSAAAGPAVRLRRWGWVLLVAALVVAPWTIRNAVRLAQAEARLGARLVEPLPRFVPVTFYGPLNLALANHAGADGTFSRDALPERGGAARLDLSDPEHVRFVLHGHRLAADWIADHPAQFGRLVLRKWGLALEALRLGWTQWNWPGGRTGVRRPVDLFVPDRGVAAWLLVPWMVAGVVIAGRRGAVGRRWLALVGATSAVTFVAVALFFGYARLVVVLLPLWLSFGGLALAAAGRWGSERWAARRFEPATLRRLAWAAVALVVALELYGAVRGHRLEATGATVPGSAKLDRDQEIRFRPLPPSEPPLKGR